MKVAIYARTSTDKQDTGNQIDLLRDLCKRRGWDIAGEYIDDAISGTKSDRPAIQQLLSAAFKHQFDAVLVFKLDRFARSVAHLIEIMDRLKSYNVELITSDGQIDTTTASGRLLWQVIGAFAEFERNLIVERTRAAYKRKKAQAGNLKQKVKWGRKAAEFDIVKAQELKAQGKSLREISKEVGVSFSTIRRALFQNGGIENTPPVNTVKPNEPQSSDSETAAKP